MFADPPAGREGGARERGLAAIGEHAQGVHASQETWRSRPAQ